MGLNENHHPLPVWKIRLEDGKCRNYCIVSELYERFTIFIGFWSGGVYKNTNEGVNWIYQSSGLDSHDDF